MGRFRRRNVTLEAEDAGGRFNFTRDVVEPFAADPDRLAVLSVDRDGVIERRTFRELSHDAARWSALFRSSGLEPADRLLVHIGNVPAWPAILLGALKAGVIAVSCPETASAGEVEFAVTHSTARCAVTDRARATAVAPAPSTHDAILVEDAAPALGAESIQQPTHDTRTDEVAVLVHDAAGPRPAAVAYTHEYLSTLREDAQQWLDARPSDTVWCSAPAGSALAVRALLGTLSCGAATVLHDGELEPEDEVALIERLGVTVLCRRPDELLRLAETAAPGRPSRLRLTVSIGSAEAPTTAAAVHDAFRVPLEQGTDGPERGAFAARLPEPALQPEPVVETAAAESGETRRLAARAAKDEERRRRALEAEAAHRAEAERKKDEQRREADAKAEAEAARRAEEAERKAARDAERRRQADEAETRRLAAARAEAEEQQRNAGAAAEHDPEPSLDSLLVERLRAYSLHAEPQGRTPAE